MALLTQPAAPGTRCLPLAWPPPLDRGSDAVRVEVGHRDQRRAQVADCDEHLQAGADTVAQVVPGVPMATASMRRSSSLRSISGPATACAVLFPDAIAQRRTGVWSRWRRDRSLRLEPEVDPASRFARLSVCWRPHCHFPVAPHLRELGMQRATDQATWPATTTACSSPPTRTSAPSALTSAPPSLPWWSSREALAADPTEQAALLLANLAEIAEALDEESVVVLEEARVRIRRLHIALPP